jgi:hypothetical protein
MNDKIQVINEYLPTVTAPQSIIHNSGDNVTQIANNQGGTINVYLPGSNGALYNAANTINKEYYNLFVVGGDTLTDPFFLVEKECALTTSEGVAPEISEQYAPLTSEAITAIKTFPSIFATVNRQYGRTDADHLALFGFVTDVRIQENGIKVCYQSLCSIPQQRLNEIAFHLAMKGASSFNELNRMHWAIKRISLVEELKAAGLSVLLPT